MRPSVHRLFFGPITVLGPLIVVVACSSSPGPSNTGGSGGQPATGGAATGGAATGGAATGGAATGGAPGTGGAAGASSTGGTSTGGAAQGGRAGGSSTGGGGGSSTSSGGAGGGSATGCADPSLLFCEDFESQSSATPTSTKWTNEVSTGTGAGTLTIDNMHSRGQKALHVHTTTNGRGLIHVKNFAPPSNSFYGRMWVWIDAIPTPAGDNNHFTMAEAKGSGNASLVRFIGGQYIRSQNGAFWGPGTDGGPTGDWTNWQTAAPTKAQTWVCMQWHASNTNSAIDISIDGVAKPDLSVSKTDHPNGGDFVFPTFNDIWFGWWMYQADSTPDHVDVWLDDLALGTAPIPCGS